MMFGKNNNTKFIMTESGKKTKFGREIPINTSVSYEENDGMVVPVVWHLGPAICGHCKSFKSLSLQALYKHMKNKHTDEIKEHQFNVKRYTINNPVDLKDILAPYRFFLNSCHRPQQ